MTGRQLAYTMFGKPQPVTYEFADLSLERQAASAAAAAAAAETGAQGASQTARTPLKRRVYMIGDNPASDISGAAGYGWESVLVRTGVWSDAQGDPTPAPTLVADNVEEAVASALRREWGADAV